MKLSIIMRTWNRIEYTIRSIVSIDKNSGLKKDEYEIICVDQGSTDGTVEWLSRCPFEGYYPIQSIFLPENVGDGRGMQEGINIAKGEFIAQHDNDIMLVTPDYYKKLILVYNKLEQWDNKVCALSGTHMQGIQEDSTPLKFGEKRHGRIGNTFYIDEPDYFKTIYLYHSAWVTASFIFRREFASHPFDKGMCNEFCGYWWDKGYDNFACKDFKFWHIDSGKTGAHIQKQYDKFPSYEYAFKHYRNFIKRNKDDL